MERVSIINRKPRRASEGGLEMPKATMPANIEQQFLFSIERSFWPSRLSFCFDDLVFLHFLWNYHWHSVSPLCLVMRTVTSFISLTALQFQPSAPEIQPFPDNRQLPPNKRGLHLIWMSQWLWFCFLCVKKIYYDSALPHLPLPFAIWAMLIWMRILEIGMPRKNQDKLVERRPGCVKVYLSSVVFGIQAIVW